MDTLVRNRIINLFLVLLLIIIAWMLGKFFWVLVDSPKQELLLPAIQNTQVNQTRSNVISPITLFGRSQTKKSTNQTLAEKDVKKTRLNLKLLGSLVGPDFGVAIIENKGKSESYSLEENIQKGVILKEVYPDYVVISHNGLLEKLQMIKDADVFIANTDSPELNQRQLTILRNVKENALKNPISIVRYVRFQMVQKNGKVASVKVWPRKEITIFRSLGFKPGDELQTVNGHSIAELSKSPTLWQSLLKKTNLELTLIRNGQIHNVSVNLD